MGGKEREGRGRLLARGGCRQGKGTRKQRRGKGNEREDKRGGEGTGGKIGGYGEEGGGGIGEGKWREGKSMIS